MASATNPALDVVIAKIMAIKAFAIAAMSNPKQKPILLEKARNAVGVLSSKSDLQSIRRRIFYRLILAEIARQNDPLEHRLLALQDGDLLSKHGASDPFFFYMQIVDAFTRRKTTANFGDLVSSTAWSHSNSDSTMTQHHSANSSIMLAIDTLNLTDEEITEHRDFLDNIDLDTILNSHGIEYISNP